MSNTPFKLRSQGSSFKMMGSSPAKHPLEEKHTHSKAKEKTEVKMDVMDPDVRNIIEKRKKSGPQDSKENQQKEITELVERRRRKRDLQSRIDSPTIEEKKKTKKKKKKGGGVNEDVTEDVTKKKKPPVIRDENGNVIKDDVENPEYKKFQPIEKDEKYKKNKEHHQDRENIKNIKKRQDRSKKEEGIEKREKTLNKVSEKIIKAFSPHTWFSD